MKKNLHLLALLLFFAMPVKNTAQTPDIALEVPVWAMNETFYKPIDFYAREWGQFYHSTQHERIYDGLYYVAQQNGIITGIHFISDVPIIQWVVALDIQDRVNDSGNERGLLGMAFHPDFPDTPYVFVNYTGEGGTTYISRFTFMQQEPEPPSYYPLIGDPESELVILTIPQPYSNHNGGDLHFGPDGYLYIGMGDGGSAGDPGNRSQNPQELLGKMLRIDVSEANEEQPYTIPPDNPFADTTDGILDEIWAFGLRNPWRFCFDQLTGDMWIGDVGQDDWEEVDFEPAGSGGGLNYGWRCYEGNHPYNTNNCGNMDAYTFPVFEYPHSSSNGCSITGGVVYRGCQYPQLYGSYLFTDYCSGKLWATRQDSLGNFITTELTDLANYNFAAFALDYHGKDLYLLGHSDGKIYYLKDIGQIYQLTETHTYACIGEANGSLELTFGDVAPQSILWSTGDTTALLENMPAGSYSVTITLANGCSESYTLDIPGMPDLTPNLLFENDTLYVQPDYADEYNWYFNGQLIPGEHENFLVPVQNGYYQVGFTAGEAACSYLSDSLLVQSLATYNITDTDISIFPNPFERCFYLSLSANAIRNKATQLHVYDPTGRKCHSVFLSGEPRQQICLPEGNHQKGIYLIELTNGESAIFKKLIRLE